MVKRKAFPTWSATVSLILFFLCILLIDPGPVAATKKPRYKWRLGSAWTQPVRNESIQLFCDLVNVYSKGKIQLRFQSRGLLGGHDEIFHGVQEGSIEMGVFAPYVNLVPGGMLNWMPWTVGSYDEAAVAYAAPDGILYRMMDKAWEEVGCKLIVSLPMGPYGIGNNVRPIRRPEDFKDLKMRVSGSLGFVMTLQNMGAGSGMTLQTIPWSDLYNALERNVVDGCWNLWSPLVEERHYEVLKYYSALGWAWDCGNIVVNLELWNKLPEDLREAIFKASKHAEERDYEVHRRMDRVYQRQLKKSGLEIYYPTQAERDRFREKAKMPDIWRELCAPWLKKHFPKQDMTKQVLDELERIKIEIHGK